jgi:hypothetical protein
MKSVESLLEVFFYDFRLLKIKIRYYYLCVPKSLETMTENQDPLFSEIQESMGVGIVALDPGVKSFQTCFDPRGSIAEWKVGQDTVDSAMYMMVCRVVGAERK